MMNFNIDPISTNNDTDPAVVPVLPIGAPPGSLNADQTGHKTRKAKTGPKTSQYKGVCKGKKGVWIAQYKIQGKTTYIGTFYTEVVAAITYDNNLFARMLDGTVNMDLNRLNFGDPRLDSTKEFVAKLTAPVAATTANEQAVNLNKFNTEAVPMHRKTCLFRGVAWCEERQCWKANIQTNKEKIYIGRYPTAEDGAKAYNAKVKELAAQEADEKLKAKLLGNLYEVPNTETKTPTNYISAPTLNRKRKAAANGMITGNELPNTMNNTTPPLEKWLAYFTDLPPLENEELYFSDEEDWFAKPPNTDNMLLFGYNSDLHLGEMLNILASDNLVTSSFGYKTPNKMARLTNT